MKKISKKKFWERVLANEGKYWDHPDVTEKCPGNYGKVRPKCTGCPYMVEKRCTTLTELGIQWWDWDRMMQFARKFLKNNSAMKNMRTAFELMVQNCGELRLIGCAGCVFKQASGCFFGKDTPDGYFFSGESVWWDLVSEEIGEEGLDHICGIIPEEIGEEGLDHICGIIPEEIE